MHRISSACSFFLCLLLALTLALAPPLAEAAPAKKTLTAQSKSKVGNTAKVGKQVKARKAALAGERKGKAIATKEANRGKASKQAALAKTRKTTKTAKAAKTVQAANKPEASKSRIAASRKAVRKARVRRTLPAVTSLRTQDIDPTRTPLDAQLELSSRCYMVMDADTGVPLVAKNPDIPRQPASTIKIVTGLIALQTLGDSDRVPVSAHAASMPASKVNIRPTKTYSANDMINAVLLASANDASVALAERIAGSESRFAQFMTLSARRWGAKNTVCRTASGLTADGQQSTARDLAQLFRVAMQNDEFARRMHARTALTSFGKTLRNHNKALWKLDGAVAGKTGFTNAARQTYVGQFSRDGHSIIVAIMGSNTMWHDLEQLVDYGFEQKGQAMARLRGAETM